MKLSDGIVVSSRIRLARNIEEYPFVHNLNEKQAADVLSLVFHACDSIGTFTNYRLHTLREEVLQEYKEDHLISDKLIAFADKSGVCVSNDNAVSIMVNEEDHLREQCTLKGLSLKRAYDIINDIDTELALNLKFSYDDRLGYLTACPTNVGTGIRASAMLFLPALTMTGNMEQVVSTVTKLGISVRGVYGEGSKASGYMFQISNQSTLGKTEPEIVQMVESTTLKLCDLETKAREQLLAANNATLKNDILRAFGVLANSYILSSGEALELLSKVKLGMALGIITLKNEALVDDLLHHISAVKITKLSNKKLNEYERDLFRAEYVGRVLKHARI